MPTMSFRWSPILLASAAAAFAVLLCVCSSAARATDLKKQEEAWAATGLRYEDALSCKLCHTRPIADFDQALDFVLLAEYSIWKTHDKHAQAFAVLVGPQGDLIGRNLGRGGLDRAEVGGARRHHRS